MKHLPPVQITKCEMDFEKGTVTVDNKEMRIKVNAIKKYGIIDKNGW